MNADLVIADLSTLNPNAFYEIGIRHMAQKPIIHMQLIEETIPFDVSLFRSIKYSRIRPRDLRSAQTSLKNQIDAILAPGYQIDNPVTRTRGAVALEKGATSGEKILLEQIKALEGRLSHVENGFPIPPPRTNIHPTPGMHIIQFTNTRGLTNAQIELITSRLVEQFGAATRIARNGSNVIIGVPQKTSIPPPIMFPDKELKDIRAKYNVDIFDQGTSPLRPPID